MNNKRKLITVVAALAAASAAHAAHYTVEVFKVVSKAEDNAVAKSGQSEVAQMTDAEVQSVKDAVKGEKALLRLKVGESGGEAFAGEEISIPVKPLTASGIDVGEFNTQVLLGTRIRIGAWKYDGITKPVIPIELSIGDKAGETEINGTNYPVINSRAYTFDLATAKPGVNTVMHAGGTQTVSERGTFAWLVGPREKKVNERFVIIAKLSE